MFSGSLWWYASVEFKHFDNLHREQQNCPAWSSKLNAKLNCE